MSGERAARRYATALFKGADEAGQADRVRADMRWTRALIVASPDFDSVLQHAAMPPAVQQRAVTAVARGHVGDMTMRFLEVLAQRRRLPLLDEVGRVYEDLYLESRRLLPILIETAHELGEDQVASIKQRAAGLYDRQIEATVRVDPALVGGFRVLVRDIVHDFSVRGKLEALRAEMAV